jgi:hypothetical protein
MKEIIAVAPLPQPAANDHFAFAALTRCTPLVIAVAGVNEHAASFPVQIHELSRLVIVIEGAKSQSAQGETTDLDAGLTQLNCFHDVLP